MQVRNGWRPSGRRSDQPAAPSKNGRFFVQLMGSTSHFEEFVDESILTPHAAPARPPHLALPNMWMAS
jgi:hypothetical protein